MLNGRFALVLDSPRAGRILAIVTMDNGRIGEVQEPTGYSYTLRRGDPLPPRPDSSYGTVILNLRQTATSPHFHFLTADGQTFHLAEAVDTPLVSGTAYKL